MWMRNPMNVMIRQSSPESASSRKARSILSEPAAIQVPTVSWSPPDAAEGSAVKKASSTTRHEPAMAPAATATTVSRDHLRPNNIRIAAPMKGSKGMRRRLKVTAASRSALHQGDFVEVDGLPAAEEADQNRQPDRRLGCRERDDQKGEHVSLEVAELAGEGDQGQVAAVQLQLDPHEDDERVPAQQDARRPDQEQHEREDQIVGGGHGGDLVVPFRRRLGSLRRARVVVAGELVDLLAVVGGAVGGDLFLVRARDHHAANDGDQEQDRDRLEGVEKVAEEDVAHGADGAEAVRRRGGDLKRHLDPHHVDELDEEIDTGQDAQHA